MCQDWVALFLFLMDGEEMVWEEVTVMEKRAEFILLASREGSNLSALCRGFGISRKTGL
jgi:hypothetical protein